MHRYCIAGIHVVVLSVMLLGCSPLQKRAEAPPQWLTQIEKEYGRFSPGEILDLDEQRPIEFETLLDRLEGKKIIYVGETHNFMDHHDIQFQILTNLYKRDPRFVIGMEMFERPFQGVLDSWVTGAIDRETLLRESEWFTRWNYDFALYEKILDFARENKIKMLALNAPREVVQKVGDFGTEALSNGEKALVAPIDTSDVLHREYIRKVFEGHRKSPGQTFENFYEAQCVWEDTMAETIADFLSTPEGEDSRVIVFSGNGHIVYKFGIPMRVYQRTGAPFATVLPSSTERIRQEFPGDGKMSTLMLADFLWVTEGIRLSKVRLGVVIEESLAHEQGMVVRKVVEGSSADDAGIEPGDIVLAMDGEAVRDIVDLRLGLSDIEPGSVSHIVYSRRGERAETEVVFSEGGSE